MPSSETLSSKAGFVLDALIKRLEAVIRAMGLVAAFGAIVLVVLVATNVLLRYFAHVGSVWSQELEWHLLAPIAMLGVPYALLHGDYVRVDVLYDRFSEKTQLRLDIFAAVIGMVVSLLLLKYSVPYVLTSWGNGEGSPDPGGLPARYVLKAVLPFGFFLLFLQQTAQVLRDVLILKQGGKFERPEPESEF